MAYWLFQGNPKYYRILDGIRGFTQMPWLGHPVCQRNTAW